MDEEMAALGFPLRYSRLNELERGHRKWNTAHLCAVSAALGISPGELLGEDLFGLSELEKQLVLSWRAAGESGVMTWVASRLPTRGEQNH